MARKQNWLKAMSHGKKLIRNALSFEETKSNKLPQILIKQYLIPLIQPI